MARFAVVIFFAVVATVSGIDLPEFIQVCKRNDPDIDACIMASVEHLKPYLVEGVPEYHLPSLEPLVLKTIVATEGTGIKVTVTNLNAYGASNFIVTKVKTDIPNLQFNVQVDIPHLNVDGEYEVDGRVLLLPVTGSGPMTGNFTDCTGVVDFSAEVIKGDNGDDYFHVTELNTKITVGKGHLNLENLFGGDKVLGDVVNNAINSNFDAFTMELLPVIEKALSDNFLEIGNNVVASFSYNQLFPE